MLKAFRSPFVIDTRRSKGLKHPRYPPNKNSHWTHYPFADRCSKTSCWSGYSPSCISLGSALQSQPITSTLQNFFTYTGSTRDIQVKMYLTSIAFCISLSRSSRGIHGTWTELASWLFNYVSTKTLILHLLQQNQDSRREICSTWTETGGTVSTFYIHDVSLQTSRTRYTHLTLEMTTRLWQMAASADARETTFAKKIATTTSVDTKSCASKN